jgi:hypothetical protein
VLKGHIDWVNSVSWSPEVSFACIPSARRLTHWHSPASRRFDPHLHTGRGHSHQRGARRPVMPIVNVPNRAPKLQAPWVRHGAWSRLPRVPTPSQQARCWGPGTTRHCLTYSSEHLVPGAIASPSSEGTQRDEPAQVGRVHPKPPRCSPFGDANGVRNSLSCNVCGYILILGPFFASRSS